MCWIFFHILLCSFFSHIVITCFNNLLWYTIFYILKQIIVIYKYQKYLKSVHRFIYLLYFFFWAFEVFWRQLEYQSIHRCIRVCNRRLFNASLNVGGVVNQLRGKRKWVTNRVWRKHIFYNEHKDFLWFLKIVIMTFLLDIFCIVF